MGFPVRYTVQIDHNWKGRYSRTSSESGCRCRSQVGHGSLTIFSDRKEDWTRDCWTYYWSTAARHCVNSDGPSNSHWRRQSKSDYRRRSNFSLRCSQTRWRHRTDMHRSRGSGYAREHSQASSASVLSSSLSTEVSEQGRARQGRQRSISSYTGSRCVCSSGGSYCGSRASG